ncbi:MAG: hypothetical protein HY973_00770 [Candidatus Kerfeldbacteria bacterium]|nr:hypothetical protein [Candidatus Kerfeldbacteria bacterium]
MCLFYPPSHKTSGGLLRLRPDVHRDEGWMSPWRLHLLIGGQVNQRSFIND